MQTNYQPTIPAAMPVQGYQMPAQAQATPPAASDLPWEPSYQPAPQAMPQAMPSTPDSMQAAYRTPVQTRQARREVPAGRYICELADVREGTTKSGLPRVSLAWRVVEGEYRGLWIWDNVTLGSPKGDEILCLKLAHVCPGWVHMDTADLYDEARRVKDWAIGRKYSVNKVAQDNGFFRIYADLLGAGA